MALRTYPSKRYYRAAAKASAGWDGTAVAVGAGDGIIITDDGGLRLKQTYDPYPAVDQIVPMDGDMGPSEAVDFNPPFTLGYNPGRMGSLEAAVFGTAGLPDPLFTITDANKYIDFDEGSTELTGTIVTGAYTAAGLATAIKTALDAAGALTYTVTFSSVTKKFTIAAATNFTLHWNTGTHKAADISTLAGYSDAADDTGTNTYTADTVAVGVAYKHTWQWADALTKVFTFVAEKPGKVWEVPSAYPYKLNLKLGAGKVQGVISLRGNTLNDDSTTNTTTELDAITYVDRGKRVQFQNGLCWLNAESGDTLDSDDALVISDMDLTWERHPDAQPVIGATYIADLIEGPPPTFTVKIKVARAAEANIDLAAFKAMTAQKMLIKFTSPLAISGTYYYSRTLYFPRLKYVEPPDVPYEDAMTTTLTFIGEESAAAPSGMSYARPYEELVNGIAADYLA